jgi:hypothetical protein
VELSWQRIGDKKRIACPSCRSVFFLLFFVLLCFGVQPVCKPGEGCSLVVADALWHLSSVFWCSFEEPAFGASSFTAMPCLHNYSVVDFPSSLSPAAEFISKLILNQVFNGNSEQTENLYSFSYRVRTTAVDHNEDTKHLSSPNTESWHCFFSSSTSDLFH